MFAEMALLSWLEGAALIAVGFGAGYFIALQLIDKQQDKLKSELENSRSELKDYREQVDRHFLKTSLLLSRLTDNYREVYEHLAGGAQSLCGKASAAPRLDLPDTHILPDTSETDHEAETELAATTSPKPDTAGDTAEAARRAVDEDSVATVPPADDAAAEDVPMGVEAASAPAEETSPQTESGDAADIDQHKTPPSIH